MKKQLKEWQIVMKGAQENISLGRGGKESGSRLSP
jgi:hypothetical protein